jgi:dienelactone hydrolase
MKVQTLQNITKNTQLILMFTWLVFLASCQSDKNNPVPSTPYLVSSELIQEVSPSSVIAKLNSVAEQDPGFSPFVTKYTPSVAYTVSVYRIKYRTIDTKGANITASALMIIPKTTNSLPLFSDQHGTITSDDEAPSTYQGTLSTILGPFFASAGYVYVAPDYLGYVASNTIEHPYNHTPTLASASRDAIRAVKEFCSSNRVTLNSKLFLTGYSEGGAATMALHKLLEEKHQDELPVTASGPGAGAYDNSGFIQYIASENSDLFFIKYYLWTLDAINKIHGLKRAFSTYLTDPNATSAYQISETNPQDFPGMTLTTMNPQTLFTNTFISGIVNKTDTQLLNAIAVNDVFDWKPKAPIHMFHGTIDDFVPIFNAENALSAMTDRGATNVSLVKLEEKDHDTAFYGYIDGAFAFFQSLK